jgi:mannosyl-oligosaccharide alpha-1,2-mannosidase
MNPSRKRVALLAACLCMVFILYQVSTLSDLHLSNILPGSKSSTIRHRPHPTDDGKFYWANVPEHYPITSTIVLPTASPTKVPQIQHNFKKEDQESENVRLERLAKVKESFTHAWQGYKAHAWLQDEVGPLSGGSRNTMGGWAATLVDCLDTLWIMDMKDEFESAVQAVQQIDFTNTDDQILNTFETTIRYLGGFLAAYDLSDGNHPVLLEKAIELGEMLYVAFDTPNRMPITRWDWKR